MRDITQIAPAINLRAVFEYGGYYHRFPVACFALMDTSVPNSALPDLVVMPMIIVTNMRMPIPIDTLDPDYTFRGYEQVI